MFDLIDESGEELENFGYKKKRMSKYGISSLSLKIDEDKKAKKWGMKQGEYYILNCPNFYSFGIECYFYITTLLRKKLRELIKKEKAGKSKVLVVGLGNPDIVSDRLGKEVFDQMEINPLSKKSRVIKFCPNIFFLTGIDTMKMVKMIVDEFKIKLVLIIDSLTTQNINRLGSSFQITTSGITPGSGLNRFGKMIDKKTIGASCISIGVPFMIFSNNATENFAEEKVLTLKDARENVETCGYIIANAISEAIKWIIIFWYLFFWF